MDRSNPLFAPGEVHSKGRDMGTTVIMVQVSELH
jgi:hypothetical protein